MDRVVLKNVRTIPLTRDMREMLQSARETRSFTFPVLATKTGYSEPMLKSIFNGYKQPSPKLLKKLCSVLQLDINVRFDIVMSKKSI